MNNPIFRMIYDGGDADVNTIDMRLLGLSLQGADRITSDGLILLVNRRSPRRGERAPLIVKVREPKVGSYDLTGLLQDAVWMLPLGQGIAEHFISGFLGIWWEAVKYSFVGDSGKSDKAVEALLDINRDHLAARDASEARAHEERMAVIEERLVLANAIRDTLAQQQSALQQFIAPIGPSVTSARVFLGGAPAVTVNNEEAEIIRSSGNLVWTGLEEIRLRTDGFRFHTSGLSIENPDKSGFLMAKVTDPRFEQQENVYTEAAQRRSEILVLARKGYRGQDLIKVDIVDFIKEL